MRKEGVNETEQRGGQARVDECPTLTRLTADYVSDKEFYSILQATGIGEKRFLNP